MSRLFTILLLLILSCGTKPSDKRDVDIKKDSIDIEHLDSEEDPVSNVEGFNDFFDKFKSDSLFQTGRVKFPWRLLITTEDGETLEETRKDDWTHLTFYYEAGYSKREIDAYTQEIKVYGDTVKLEIRGVDNGIYTDFEFAIDNGKWFLVSGKDYSN